MYILQHSFLLFWPKNSIFMELVWKTILINFVKALYLRLDFELNHKTLHIKMSLICVTTALTGLQRADFGVIPLEHHTLLLWFHHRRQRFWNNLSGTGPSEGDHALWLLYLECSLIFFSKFLHTITSTLHKVNINMWRYLQAIIDIPVIFKTWIVLKY